MLSVETRINGIPISLLYIHNEGVVDESNENCNYYVEYHKINQEPKITEFKIKHKRGEGVEKLLLLAYRGIDRRLKKEGDKK